MFHTGMFYTYEDQYGWTVSCTGSATREARFESYRAPRSFASRAEAERWITATCEEAATC